MLAQTPEIAKGVNWLQSQVQADGAVAGEGRSIASPYQSRAEVALTLARLATLPESLAQSVARGDDGTVEALAREVQVVGASATETASVTTALLQSQNEDGGFGGASGFASNPLDTAWAILGLMAANSNDSSAISAASNYLIATQDASGGYSVPGNRSNSYTTALAVSALQLGASGPATDNALNKANAWLLSQQQSDGSWGDTAETSVVYLALLGSLSDSALQSSVTTNLLARQASDGSWNGDPYSTALVLRALVAQPRPTPTTGNVILRVVDGSMGQPLAGATVVLQNAPVEPSISDGAGAIAFTEVPAGEHTLIASAPGYASQSLSFSLKAGTTVDLGVVAMPAATATGLLRGLVTDGATGAPLGDVTISASGAETVSVATATDGSYSIPGLAPGVVSVTATKSGYLSIGGTGEIVAGGVLVFSPSMPPAGQSAGTTGSIIGTVIDGVTRSALAGVAVTVETAGVSTTTAADGRFGITNIPAGTSSVTFSLAGYAATAVSVLIPAGATVDFQTIAIAKTAGTTVTVLGTITDASSGRPIGSASVTALGTSITATTDSAGNYRIDGLPTGSASLRFSASGYVGETVAATFASTGEYRLDRRLSLDAATNPSFSLLATDKSRYPAYAPVTVRMELTNNSTQPIADASVDVAILDPHGQVVNAQQAIRVDSDGVAQSQFTFHPNTTAAIEGKWNTLSYPPGTYQVKARVFQDDAGSRARLVLAERSASFDITPSRTVVSLKVAPLPAFTNFDATEQQRFKVEVAHQSNLPVDVPFTYQFKTPSGTLLKEESGVISLQPNDVSGSVVLGPFEQHYAEGGIYPVVLTSTGDPVPQAVVSGEIHVAPGIRVEASQSVAPSTVTPDGDKRIRIQLQLRGVEQK